MKGCTQETLKRGENVKLINLMMLYRSDKLNIVIEDSAKEFIYEIVFEKLFDRDIKVLSSGCKNTSIKLHSKLLEKDKDKVVFIIDGDFDILFCSDQYSDLNNLVCLDKYDIEAYFIKDVSMLAAARLSFKCTKEKLQEHFNFNIWYTNISQKLSQLFTLFAIAHSHGICMKQCTGNKSIGEAFNYFIVEDGNISTERLDKLDAYLAAKLPNLSSLKEEIFLKVSQNFQSPYDFISGKYYIKSFKNRMIFELSPHLGKVAIKDDFFIGNVYSNSDINNFSDFIFLKQKVLNCLN